jgi:protein-S-isoprenylcysteine O-methyltransferase Ste14
MTSSHLPLAGIVALVVIGLVVRPLIHLSRYGTSGILLFRGGAAHKIRDAMVVVLLTGFIAQGIRGPGAGSITHLLLPEDSLALRALEGIGAALLLIGTLLFAAAQLNLGASWRIGIDPCARPGIVSSGLYRFSRHPIYLGFLTVFTGYGLMLPTPLSILLLACGYVLFRAQADAEEAHLLRTYGEPYRAYAGRVGRFFPGLGKGTR